MRDAAEPPANAHHVLLRRGAKAWNAWRRANPGLVPDLNRAPLEHAALVDANLSDAVLVRADLSHARLERADLRRADLSHAVLDDSDLERARLEGTILYGAQLHYARNLTQAQIDRARGDRNTALPAHLAMPARWLKDARAGSQLEKPRSRAADLRGDLYAALGVKPGASPKEIRAAYLKLVKDLHPDGRLDDPIAGERLKTINRAYHDLKERERRAASRRSANGSFGSRSMLFCIGLAASTIPMLVLAGVLLHARYLSGAEGPRVALATTPAAEPEMVMAATSEPTDDAAWAEAEREGTSAALRRYLGRYPSGRHAKRATEDMAVVAASEATLDTSPEWRDRNTAGADRLKLSRYVERYPNGRFVGEIHLRLALIEAAETIWRADDTAWSDAERNSTREGLQRYLDAHPRGDHADKAQLALTAINAAEARRRAEQTARLEAERAGITEPLQQYLDGHPSGDHAGEGRQARAVLEAGEHLQDDLAWSATQQRNTKASYAAYLNAHPKGRHAEDARARLAELERLELKVPNTATVKASGNATPQARTSGALGRMLWPSADEPFTSADRRIRPQ